MELNSLENKTDEHNKLKLKDGMVVELRNNERYLLREVEGKFILSNHDWWLRCNYNSDLTYAFLNISNKNQFDIMKVYESNAYALNDLFNDDCLTCVWEREEPKKMTVDEISKALGFKVEVVDSLDISIDVSDHEDEYDCR